MIKQIIYYKYYKTFILNNLPCFCIADIHGQYSIIDRIIKENELKNCYLILLGDIGLGFLNLDAHYAEYKTTNDLCKKQNVHVFMIRGNHDDPKFFEEDILRFSNIHTVKDYTLLKNKNITMLCVGGAISIDRIARKQNYHRNIYYWKDMYPSLDEEKIKEILIPSYWENEKPVFNDVALEEMAKNGEEINVILSHTCPSFSYPREKNGIKPFLRVDSKLLQDINNERDVMDKIFETVKSFSPLKKWYYGHYHIHKFENIDGVDFLVLTNADDKIDIADIRLNEDEESFVER